MTRANPFSKVQSGAAMEIPAEAYNAFIDAAMAHRGNAGSIHPGTPGSVLPANVVLVRNDTGSNLAALSVLGNDGAILHQDAFLPNPHRPVLKGVVPTDDHVGNFMILREACPQDQIATAWIGGVAPARVQTESNQGEVYCDAKAGSFQLVANAQGTCRVLWKMDSPVDNTMALIRFGTAPPPVTSVFVVDLTLDGGEPGGSGNDCTYTYTASLSGDQLGTELTPVRGRMNGVAYTPASIGLARYDANGNVQLLDAFDETPQTSQTNAAVDWRYENNRIELSTCTYLTFGVLNAAGWALKHTPAVCEAD